MSQNASPLEAHREEIERLLTQGLSLRQIASRLPLKTSDRSVGRALRRWGLEVPKLKPDPDEQKGPWEPKFTLNGDEAELTGKPNPREWTDKLNRPDDMLKERGLDPEDWDIVNVVVNEWDSPTGETMKQLKLFMKRKKNINLVVPARVDLVLPPQPTFSNWNLDEPELVVICGDQQAPYYDKALHRAFLQFLAENRPHRGVLLGDTIDLPTISRHPDEPDWAATTQECVDAAGQLLYEYVNASRNTSWVKLPGNHDERLRRAVIDRLADWYGLSPARVAELPDLPPIHDPVHLLRLDELGIEYIRPKGSYDHAQYTLSKHLAVRHGWLTRKSSGQAALATLDHLGHSIIVGHTHKQSRVHQTKFDIEGQPSTLTAVETGCMADIKEGLGYAVNPDWQNGFATATIWPDGTFSLDLATFVNDTLYWRDKRY